MKLKHWLPLTLALATGLVAQHVFADAPAAPPKSAANKKSTAADKPAAPPSAPEPAVVKEKVANVRGQAAINSEIVSRLKRGDKVTILEEITLKKPKADEPAKWARIALPSGSGVWVHSSFIDATTKAVRPKRLNLRSGPGENYSILGRLDRGVVVKEIEAKGEWLKIESPAESYAFVAAHLLAKEPATPPPPVVAAIEPPKPVAPVEVVAVPPATPPPVPPPSPVVATPPATPPPAETPIAPPTATSPAPNILTPVPASPAGTAPVDIELVKRVVSREGIVRRSVSIQAPTYFVLESLDNGKTINYLHSSSTNILLKSLAGKRILVTGEEALDERWSNTPVITVETLQTVP